MLIYSSQRSDDPWATDESDSVKCNSEKAETNKINSGRGIIYNLFDLLIEKYHLYAPNIHTGLQLVILLLLVLSLVIIYRIPHDDYGLVIQQFAAPDLGNSMDGTDIAELLACELMDIQKINKKANSIQADAINSSIEATIDKTYPKDHEQEQEHQLTLKPINSNLPRISLKQPSSLVQTESPSNYLKNIGTISVAGSSLSIGNSLLFIMSMIEQPKATISGNLQIYGPDIILVAEIENSSNKHMTSWKVTRTLNGSSIGESIPSMVSELAFDIYSSPDSGFANEIDSGLDWETFKYFEEGEKSFINYVSNNNLSELMEARDRMMLVARSNNQAKSPLYMLTNISFFLIDENMCQEARDTLRYCCPFDQVKCDLGMALAFYKEENYYDAITACERLFVAEPIDSVNATAKLLYGCSLASLSDYSGAIRCFSDEINAATTENDGKLSKTQEIDAKELIAALYFNKGLALAGQNKSNEAIQAYDQALKEKLGFNAALYYKGWTLNDQTNYKEALDVLKQALRLNQSDTWVWREKAYAFYKLKEYDNFDKAYDQIIQLNPDKAYAWCLKGWTLNDLGNFSAAIDALDMAIDNDPDYGYAWNERGYALNRMERSAEAISSCEHALEIDPNFADAWYNKGKALERLASYREANDSFVSYYYCRGNDLIDKTDYSGAIDELKKAIPLDPNNSTILIEIGYSLSMLDRFDEALSYYESATIQDPNSATALCEMGYVLVRLERFDYALSCCERALEIDPYYADAWYNKSLALDGLGSKADAQNAFSRAWELGYNR